RGRRRRARSTIHSSPAPGRCGLFVALADSTTEADLAVVYPDIETAVGVGADPRLEGDRCSITPVIREWEHEPDVALATLWVTPLFRHLSSPPLNSVRGAAYHIGAAPDPNYVWFSCNPCSRAPFRLP